MRGGEEREMLLLFVGSLKEWRGRRSESESEFESREGWAEEGMSSAIVPLTPRKKDRFGPAEVVKWGCFRGLMGEDCESWCWSFQEVWLWDMLRPAEGEERKRLRAVESEAGSWKLAL